MTMLESPTIMRGRCSVPAFGLLTAALSLVSACGEAPDVPEPSLEGMEVQVAQKIEQTRVRVMEDPGSAAAWGALGFVFEAHGLRDEARLCYQEASTIAPDDYRWPYYKAWLASDDVISALGLASEAARLRPRSVPVLVRKASLEEQLGRAGEAKSTYEKLLSIAPETAIVQFALGRLALSEGELDDAEKYLRRASELQPRAGAIHGTLTRLHRMRGDMEAARAAAARASELDPDIRFDDALRRAVADEEVSTRGLQTRASSAEARGNVAAAEALHLRLRALHPGEAEIHYNSANFLVRVGRSADAEPRYRRVLELDRNYSAAYVNLGNLLAERGELVEAESLLRRAVELEPEEASARVGLSNALAKRGVMEEAGTLLEGVLECDPGHLHALLGLSQIRAAADRLRDANELLLRALEEHPDDGRAHFLMALTSARRGQLERAWTHVREAERLRFPVPEDFVAALRESAR